MLLCGALVILAVGCKKRKIQANLDEFWQLSVYSVNGINEVAVDDQFTLNFSYVDKGVSSVEFVKHYPNGISLSYEGTAEFNSEFTELHIQLNGGLESYVWNLVVNQLDEQNLYLTGSGTNNSESCTIMLKGAN